MENRNKKNVPSYEGALRSHMIQVPICISQASGIRIFGRRIKSLVFSTDVAIIKNTNADAVISVYPFTPQPVIIRSVLTASDMPVFAGIGGGTTNGQRVVRLGCDVEDQGASGVVVNAPISNDIIYELKQHLEIPIVVTVVSDRTEIQDRIDAGASIVNISGAAQTASIVRKIRAEFPDLPIIATGGPTEESIRETIAAGANAITYTPPTTGTLFAGLMEKYRKQMEQDASEEC